MFRNRLQKVYRHLSKQARNLGVSCYRVYDHDLPEFPVCIEQYGDKLYVAEYKRRHGLSEEMHDAWMEQTLDIAAEILEIPKDHIFLKLRQRKPGRLGQYQRVGKELHVFTVEEAGLLFRVNLSDYLDTGLFLDHRITRAMVREQSRDKDVLNLFAYTGSFSVYAAAGGARSVKTVDLSKTYLQWARENMESNGFRDESRYSYVHADVKQYLLTVPDQSVDLIVMDPPTFSNSQRMKDILDIRRDHPALINQCLRILRPGGTLWFSTNARTFELETGQIQPALIRDITRATTPFDFTGKLYRCCYTFTRPA